MSNVRVLCKGLVIHEPEQPAPIDAQQPEQEKARSAQTHTAIPSYEQQTDVVYNRKLLLDKAEHELYRQLENIRAIDTKTGIILGFTLVSMAQVLLAVSRVSLEELALFKSHMPLLYLAIVLFIVAMAATLWATSFGLLALEPRRMKVLSVKNQLETRDIPTPELLSVCLKGLASGIDWNLEAQSGKLKQSRYAAYGVGVALVCYVGIAATVLLMLLLR